MFSRYFLLLALLFICSWSLKSFSSDSKQINNKYKVSSIHKNSSGIYIRSEYTGNETFYKNETNKILLAIEASITFQSNNELRIVIRDQSKSRWEIPEEPHNSQSSKYIYDKTHALYRVDIQESPFAFKVVRVATNEIVFNTANFNFIYSDRYIEFTSTLPSKNIFGIGERVYKMKLSIPGLYTIWNRDLPAVIDDGQTGAKNTYGLHPLYLSREKKGGFNLVYFRNSNGMDILLNNTIYNDKGSLKKAATITYKVVGGVIDLKFFIGNNSPEEVVKMYHEYIGGYTLQPFWSFGFHQCRWGYYNLSMLNDTLSNYHSYGMPLDTIWMDIDYMADHAIFTIDESRYNLTDLHYLLEEVYQKHLVLIIDPGVAVRDGYLPYTEGIKRDVFIKNVNNEPLLSCVWPGQTHFPDFMSNKTQDYWSDMFGLLYEKVKFSGIWLDMNELSNFVDGEVGPGECGKANVQSSFKKAELLNNTYHLIEDFFNNRTKLSVEEVYDKALESIKLQNVDLTVPSPSEKCGYSPSDYFYIYNPGETVLDHKTLCLNGKHIDGNIEYDVHNFNGYFECLQTYNYLKERLSHSQPFLLSRSTAPGSGKYTAHWTGDNVSTYQWMKLSIAGIINFNIYGIPNTGADICGFAGDTTEELCSRWMQLGSLYPFSRNHNTLGARAQDPFAFGETLVKTSFKSLKLRYSLLKYYYSLFVKNKGAGTVMRPLFFEFPNESKNYQDEVLDEEFLIGKDLLVTPVLEQGIIHIRPYFPGKKTSWFEIHSGKRFKGGESHTITNRLNETAPVFIREGGVIFRQNVDTVNKSSDLDNVFYLSAALNSKTEEAKGEIMLCENYSDYQKLSKCIDGECFLNVHFKILENKRKKEEGKKMLSIVFSEKENSLEYDSFYLSGLKLYGIKKDVLGKNKKALNVDIINIVREKYEDIEWKAKATVKGEVINIDFGQKISIRPNDVLIVKF